eukprot:1949855-Rhodomonas_salina.13
MSSKQIAVGVLVKSRYSALSKSSCSCPFVPLGPHPSTSALAQIRQRHAKATDLQYGSLRVPSTKHMFGVRSRRKLR